MAALTDYQRLLDDYYNLILKPGWGEGRREEIVVRMDQVWVRLSTHEREVLVRKYMEAKYQALLG